jgi:MFS transporter, DHA3 family, macrolide efflux protein
MKKPEGFAAFATIWTGQIGSAVGTRMTAFALGLFIWDRTGKVTAFVALSFCSFAATVLFSPLAGALVDRWNRRLTIVLSDLGSLVTTSGLLVLFSVTTVHIWMLYIVATLTGAFLAFQYPVYSSTISQMLKRGEYPRANAMMSLVNSLPGVASPALAAMLLTFTTIRVILAIDVASYLLGIGTVFLVTLPARAAAPAGDASASAGIWRDSLYGFRYIWRSRPLTALLSFSFTIGLIAGITYSVMLPLVLAQTGNSSLDGGIVQSVGAAGGVVGGIAVGILGSREDKMRYILGGTVLLGLFGRIMYGLSDSILLWSAAQLVAWGSLPLINGYTQAIWQEKVEHAYQGRVFAAQNFVENLSLPIALGVSGLLADRVFGPSMQHHGFLARVFGGSVGAGPGAGMAVMCVIGGALLVLTGAVAYVTPVLRNADKASPATLDVAVTPVGDQAAGDIGR